MKVLRLSAALTALLLAAVPAFAKVGTHNGFITLNGGFNYGKMSVSKYMVDLQPSAKGAYSDQLGGAVGFDIGYQYFSGGKIIHGADAVIGMNAGFENFKGNYFDGTYTKAEGEYLKTGSPTLVGYVSSTYSLGFHAAGTRFMFDVLGLQLAFGQLSMRQFTFDPATGKMGDLKTEKTDTIFNVGLNLPLGFRAVMDNGFIIGFRHSLSFNCAYKGTEKDGSPVSMIGTPDNNRMQDLMNYNMMFSIGFAFGK